MENDFRNYQNVSKVVKDIPPNFTRTVKTSKCGGARSGRPRDSASVQKIDKGSLVSSSDPHVTTAANNTPLNKQSTTCVDEATTLREMPCSKDTASQQQALHVGHQKVNLAAMTNKNQKVFAKLPGLSNPLLHGLSSGDCDRTSKTDVTSLSSPNKGQLQQQKSLNYDVGHVFGDLTVAQSGDTEPNQALSNTNSSSNNLFFRASHNTLQVPGETTGVCQSSPNTCSNSFADISHQNASESIKNNNFYDNSNTQNVNCKMILSGVGRETSIPVTRTPAQPAACDQPSSTGESPKPNLPSTSNPCRTETNTKSNMAITDPERLALIKQRKRERKFRKLQSLSALMRAPDDRHSMVQLNPLRRDRITQENFKQDSGNYSGNSTGSSRLGDITQNPFNWVSSSGGASASTGTALNFEKKAWRADTSKKTCSFFHEPSLRNNSVLSENFSEMTKIRVDYKTEKKLNDSGSNSWQFHNSNSSVVDDALRVAALKHIKNESPLDDHLLLSASGKVLDINSSNKRILENFLTPRVKKEDSGSESSSSVSSEEENCLSPKIKGLGCKEKMWGSPSKRHRPKFGGNMVKFKNGETDSSSLDHFRSAFMNNYQKRTDSVDYETPGVHSDKSNNTSEDETDNESDSNDDDANKSSKTKLFGNMKRKSYKANVKRRGRPPLSDKYKSQSHKTAKRRGRPPLMSNFGKGEALAKQTKLEKPTTMELDTKPQLKSKDDTADSKIPKRRGRPPKKITNPASASASPTPMSIDTPTPAVALSSLNAPTLVDGSNSVDVSPTSPLSELTSEELLKARLNLPRRRGRPSKVDVMLREMAAAHLAAGQPMALPTPEAVAAALAQTAEVPAKKKKVYARRRYHAYGQRKRRRRKNTSLLRTLSTVAAGFDAGVSSELAGGEEGASGVSSGGVNFHQMTPAHQTAYNEVEQADDDDEEEEEDEEGEDMEGKVEGYSNSGSTTRKEEDKALVVNKRHSTDRHRRHHRHHHHQLQESQGHSNNNNNSHHRQLPLSSLPSSSSSPQALPSSANIVVSLNQLPHHAEPAGEEQQQVEEPNTKKRQKKRKKDAGGEQDVKKQRSGEVVSGTSVDSSNNNNNNNNNNNTNNNNSLKAVVKQEEEEEDSVLLANGNTFRVKMMKSKPSNSAKSPAPTFANLKGVKKEVGVEHSGEENKPAAAHTAEKPKSRNKKTTPSSSFSSSTTKAGVIKISRNSNNNNKNKTNSSSSSSNSSSTTTTTTSTTTTTTPTSATPAVGGTTRQIAPPVYNVPRVMLPPCIKDDGIACLMCGRVHTQDHFFKYMELKSTETSHRCPLCGQFFSWSCLFIEHMRGHPENTAQYRCEYCGSVSRKISSYFNCRITHCPPSQEWFDLQKACDDYLASLENKSSSAAAKKRRKAAAAAAAAAAVSSSPSTVSSSPSTKKKGSSGEGGGGGDGNSSGGGGGGRSRKKPSVKQQEKDGANASMEKTQSPNASQQNNTSVSGENCSNNANNNNNNSNSNNKRKGQKQSKGRRSSTDTKAPVKSTKSFVCDVCGKSFLNLKLFTKHKELHKTETSVHWCKECNKQFSNLDHLNAHKCSHNTTEEAMTVTNVVCGDNTSEGISKVADNNNSCSSDSNFKCSLCGAVFPDAMTYKNHIEICDALPDNKGLSGPHKCSICERSFKFKQSLLNHMRRHTGERPFVCELCDKTFMQAGNLERHRRTHERDTTIQSPVEKSNDKLFTCEYCEKVFTVEATYQVHLKEHNSEGSEQLHCPYCDKQFPSRHMLKLHKRTHNEHRPFKCSTCSRCYKHKHSLVEHQHNCR